MHDYYLKTTDEAAMLTALIEAGVATEQDGQLVPDGIALDVIGTWYERTSGTDEAPVYTAVPGWHFNVRSAEPIEWPASVTQHQPASPWRVWA